MATRRKSIDERMAHVPSANVGEDAPQSDVTPGRVSESQVAKLPASQKALMIVNAGRLKRGEEPLKSLPQ